jgi:hypothetical protein
VQRTAKQGAGVPYAPVDEEKDGVRIIQPRDTSGQGSAWLELWKVAGREIPLVPVPASVAEWLRKNKKHHLGQVTVTDPIFHTWGVDHALPDVKEVRELRRWLEGLTDSDGACNAEVATWLRWTCTSRPDATSADPQQMQLDPPKLSNPVKPFCLIGTHKDCSPDCPGRRPMSLVFPLIEKAPHKEFAFVDKQGRVVELASRRHAWLQEQFQGEQWWAQLTQLPREVDEYRLLKPEMEHLVRRVLGLTTQGLATPFNAMRSMDRVHYAREASMGLTSDTATTTSPDSLARHAEKVRLCMEPHLGHTRLYAVHLDSLLWIPVTVEHKTGPDCYTVTLHVEEWRRRNPSLVGVPCAGLPVRDRRGCIKKSTVGPIVDAFWAAMANGTQELRWEGVQLWDIFPLWADPVDPALRGNTTVDKVPADVNRPCLSGAFYQIWHQSHVDWVLQGITHMWRRDVVQVAAVLPESMIPSRGGSWNMVPEPNLVLRGLDTKCLFSKFEVEVSKAKDPSKLQQWALCVWDNGRGPPRGG